MAKRIEEFLRKNSRPDKIKQFEKLSQGKTKEEIRELEENIFTPEPIAPYAGESIRYVINSEHSVRFVFANQEEMDLFSRFVPIAEYTEKSVTDIKIILDLFRKIEAREIGYDKKNGNFFEIVEPVEDLPWEEPGEITKEEKTIELPEKSETTTKKKFFRNSRFS